MKNPHSIKLVYNTRNVATKLISFAVFGAIYVYSADFQHYTWIDILVFGLWLLFRVIRLEHNTFWFTQCIQIQVMCAVILFSFANCAVFRTAYNENGPIIYIAGNFAMHYLGSPVVYALSSRKDIYCSANSIVLQCATAYGVNAIWHHFEDPMVTYGCSLPGALGSAGILSISIIVAIVAMYITV